MSNAVDALCEVNAVALCDLWMHAARTMNPHMEFTADVSMVARSLRAEVERKMLDVPGAMAHRMEVAG